MGTTWQAQMSGQIRTLKQLEALVELTEDERAAVDSLADRFRLGISPYYMSLMDPKDPDCPIRRQAIPRMAEADVAEGETLDPLAEDRDMPVAALTRRYPNRALLYVTHTCGVYCRHCTRRRKVSNSDSFVRKEQWREAAAWLEAHPEVDDLVLSGGDPLTLSDNRVRELLECVRPHVTMIRIGTRQPTTLPQRITPELCALLAEFQPIYIMTHFNHPKECTPEAALALDRLADAGCVLSNQAVLLKGVNDSARTLSTLHKWLLSHRCRPYRLYHCDYTEGTQQFRVSFSRGLEIMRALRGPSSGLAMPEYMVDLPYGWGKVLVSEGEAEGGTWKFTSWEGRAMLIEGDGLGAVRPELEH